MPKIEYPNIPFALRPVHHDDSVPMPKPPKSYTLDPDLESEGNEKWPLRSETITG
jgi:hypothetical protein